MLLEGIKELPYDINEMGGTNMYYRFFNQIGRRTKPLFLLSTAHDSTGKYFDAVDPNCILKYRDAPDIDKPKYIFRYYAKDLSAVQKILYTQDSQKHTPSAFRY